jgi:hypothetical protein
LKSSLFVYTLFALLIFVSTPVEAAAAGVPNNQLDPANAPSDSLSAPSPVTRFFTEGEWYFSWGYNTETWAPTDIHVFQPSLGNDFTIHNVKGHDEPGWTSGIFNKGPFAPQNNIRVGRFIDEDHTLAIELSLDHTKYTSTVNQTARVSGTINGTPVDSDKLLDEKYFRYNLHNGANHLMINIVKRVPLIGTTNESLSLSALGKAGAGLMVPHSDNTIMGQSNNVGKKEFGNFFGTKHGWWQFDGVTAGIEAGVRFVLARPVYLELTDKVAYARLYDIPVYMGKADHSLWMNEVILSLGFTYDGSKKAIKH